MWENTKQVRGKRGAEDRKRKVIERGMRGDSDVTQAARVVETLQRKKI